MSSGAGENDAEQAAQPMAWYRSPIWLLLIVVLALAFWLSHTLSGKPAAVALQATSLQTIGPNLLKNPSFSQDLQGWVRYHNVLPMEVTAKNRAVEVKLDGARNSVQEVYQLFDDPPSGTLVATGRVRISGAPLPGNSSVVVMFVDSSNHAATKFYLWGRNGTGTFPFAFAYAPDGTARQFVLGVVVGKVSSYKTVVTFEDLKIAQAKTASNP